MLFIWDARERRHSTKAYKRVYASILPYTFFFLKPVNIREKCIAYYEEIVSSVGRAAERKFTGRKFESCTISFLYSVRGKYIFCNEEGGDIFEEEIQCWNYMDIDRSWGNADWINCI